MSSGCIMQTSHSVVNVVQSAWGTGLAELACSRRLWGAGKALEAPRHCTLEAILCTCCSAFRAASLETPSWWALNWKEAGFSYAHSPVIPCWPLQQPHALSPGPFDPIPFQGQHQRVFCTLTKWLSLEGYITFQLYSKELLGLERFTAKWPSY